MESFEQLLIEHRGAVERYVRYRISSKSDADDVLQEVYISAFRRFEQLRKAESFKPWILSIARNKCVDFMRSRPDELAFDELPENAIAQSRFGLIGDSAVAETLDMLSFNDKQILELCYYSGLKQTEIAQKLRIPLGTVKSRLNTAKKNFRKNYPYPPKGAYFMKRLPKTMSSYTIIPQNEAPFSVKWEELSGWFIVPRLGEKLCWGMYDRPSQKGDRYYEMEVVGKAEIHGIEGVEIIAREHEFGGGAGVERRFTAQLTETHCRFLAESHIENGVKKITTFLDSDDFMPKWGIGEDNSGNETRLAPKGYIERQGNKLAAKTENAVDIVGRYTVEMGKRSFDTVCVIDASGESEGVLIEQFIDEGGRTVLWRRFNADDWNIESNGRTWSEMLPENERLELNGRVFVHWYDCITDRVL